MFVVRVKFVSSWFAWVVDHSFIHHLLSEVLSAWVDSNNNQTNERNERARANDFPLSVCVVVAASLTIPFFYLSLSLFQVGSSVVLVVVVALCCCRWGVSKKVPASNNKS